MPEDYSNLIVVIPTRNRANLAVGAIRSVLGQNVDNVRILVSDNSTIAAEAASLSRFCRQLKDRRLDYVTSPEPLSMGAHWDWAMRYATNFRDASHFTVLTDRMIFRPGDLKTVIDLVRDHPRKIVSYKHDKIVDYKKPVTLFTNDWTGSVFAIDSKRLLALTSQSMLHECLPRMLNCIVPRGIIEAIISRFGTLMNSFGPDFCFCYRALALEDEILFYDKAVLIHRALDRSNGQSVSHGLMTQDHADFLTNVDKERYFFAAPIPPIRTGFNVIIHEYCLVKNKSKSPKFPDIDVDKYLQVIASELDDFKDEILRNEMREILNVHGWTDQRNTTAKKAGSTELPKPLGIGTKLKSTLPKRCWPFFSSYFGILPPEIDGLSFKSSEQALAYALKFPRRPCASLPWQEFTLEYKRIEHT